MSQWVLQSEVVFGSFKKCKIRKFIKENLIRNKSSNWISRKGKVIICIKSFESQGNLKLVLQNRNFISTSFIINLPHIVESLMWIHMTRRRKPKITQNKLNLHQLKEPWMIQNFLYIIYMHVHENRVSVQHKSIHE